MHTDSIVARLFGSSLGCAGGMVDGYLLVLGTFLFKGCGQIKNNLVVIGTLLVPFDSRLVVSIQVYHVVNEGTGVVIRGFFTHFLCWCLTLVSKSTKVFPSLSKLSVRNRCSLYLILSF